ncbi:MAG: DUF58 domain-containing protein [Actinobacteria bacterium]|nr:DUF58 domain-containing protein [Actinomycetota bacterium]MBW3651235.1 DUF58 domain-containing protein [Actinomycetota bacterium]
MTRRGWSVVAATVALLVGGRVLGLVELYILAAGTGALCAAALGYVTLHRLEVRTERVLHPPRVHAGGSSRVDLSIHNAGGRRTPVLEVRDPFDQGWRWARFLVPPLAPGASSRAAYRLPTEERGIFDIGPLEVALSDPFGLARSRSTSAAVTQLTVYPRIDVVSPLPAAHGQDPHSGAQHPRALLGQGEEFYALRPYEVGDDLRRVHWASTARVDDLMIRQDEMPWQSRVTILVDVRHRVHTPESLELAVSAAASIHSASLRERSLIRLVSTDGTDSGTALGHAHSEAILEHLATVVASRQDRLAGVADILRRAGNGGVLAIVTTDRVAPADLEVLGRLRARYSRVVLVLFERTAYESGSRGRPSLLPPAALPAVSAVVRVTATTPFAAAWEQAASSVGAAR